MSPMSRRTVQRKKTAEAHESILGHQQAPVTATVAQHDTQPMLSDGSPADLASMAQPEDMEGVLAERSLGHDFGAIRVTQPRSAGAPTSPDGGDDAGDDPRHAPLGAMLSNGSPLPGNLKSEFESSFARDLRAVRVHSDSESAEAARLLGARAFTVGRDVYIGHGQYDPSSHRGKQLLAHEVAHTVQQGLPNESQHAGSAELTIGDRASAAELEADAAAAAVV